MSGGEIYSEVDEFRPRRVFLSDGKKADIEGYFTVEDLERLIVIMLQKQLEIERTPEVKPLMNDSASGKLKTDNS